MSCAVAGPNGPMIATPNMIGARHRLRDGAITPSLLYRFRASRFWLCRPNPARRERQSGQGRRRHVALKEGYGDDAEAPTRIITDGAPTGWGLNRSEHNENRG